MAQFSLSNLLHSSSDSTRGWENRCEFSAKILLYLRKICKGENSAKNLNPNVFSGIFVVVKNDFR